MKCVNLVRWMLVFINTYSDAEKCQQGILVEKHRCVVSLENIISNKSAQHHICKTECIERRNCLFVNYNKAEGRCSLCQSSCIRLEADAQSDMAFFGSKSELCLRWIPNVIDRNGMLACGDDTCSSHVGRALKDSHLLPGDVFTGILHTVLNGIKYKVPPMGHLDVMYGCQVIWVPFTAGDALPHQAVVGGYLSSEDGIPLYIVKGAFGNDYSNGYYDPVAKMGYIEYFGPN